MKIISLSSGSHGNSYLVKEGEDVMLIEAGLPPKKLKERLWDNDINISDIDMCLISHVHQDHFKAAEYLTGRGVDVYLPEDTRLDFTMEVRLDRVNYLKGNTINRIGNFVVRTMDLEHDGIINFGFYGKHIETEQTFFYATDTMYIRYRPTDVNYWLVEVNYQGKYLEQGIIEGKMDRGQVRRIKRSHMGLDTAVEFFRNQNLHHTKEIWLLHLSDRNSNPEEVKKEVQKVTGKEVYIA